MTTTQASADPAEADVLGWFDSLSNWGRWGPEDQRGTLNLITDGVRRAAAASVRHGRAVSCAWPLSTAPQPGDHFGAPHRFMLATGEGLNDPHHISPVPPVPGQEEARPRMNGALEYLGLVYHGANVTHLDAPSHMFWDARMYGGKPAELVSAIAGAVANDVTAAAGGIVTRGVLLDMPALRDTPWLEPGDAIRPAELEEAQRRQRVSIRPGDAVFLRTGWGLRKREIGVPEMGQPGWHATAMPWLREHDVAVIGADTANDVVPSGYPAMPLPVHVLGIVAMGLWLIDNADLESLAATAAELRQWDFLLSVAPLPFAGATGSPVNPVAVF